MRFKNTIIYENDTVIKKIFHEELDFYTEYKFYEQFAYFPYIPKLVGAKNYSLYLEYIDGESIYNINMEKQLLLAKTLAHFHNETYDPFENTAVVHYDTNLNNYIYRDDKVFMIDFSDISIESPLVDIYSVLLFFAEMYELTQFLKLKKEFQSTYMSVFRFDLPDDKSILEKEILRFETRRTDFDRNISKSENYWVNKINIV